MDTIFIYLLMFSDYRFGGLCLADWALIILIIKALLKYDSIPIKKHDLIGLFIMMLGILLSTVLNINKAYFNLVDCILSTGKLTVYLLGVSVVPRYIVCKGIDLSEIIKKFLKVSVLGAVLQYAIVAIFGRDSWPLYSLGGNFFGLNTNDTMFNNLGMMRARSFWSEPAHYAITISMLFILVLYFEKNKTSKMIHVIYIIGIITANSISGYGIMFAIYAIYLINIKSVNKIRMTIFSSVVLLVGLCVLILTNDYLRRRMKNLFVLKDSSGVVRTVGGFHFLSKTPWHGVGIGNNVSYYKSLGEMNTIWYSGSGEFYNNILLAVILMGYIGAIGFILYQYSILKKRKKIFWSLMVTHFGWGKLFVTPIWIFLIFYLVLEKGVVQKEHKIVKERKWLT